MGMGMGLVEVLAEVREVEGEVWAVWVRGWLRTR